MTQADTVAFNDLKTRVEALETSLAKLRDRVKGRDISDEVLGPRADPEERKRMREELNAAFTRRNRAAEPEAA